MNKFNESWEFFKKNKVLAYNYDEIASYSWGACKSEILKELEKSSNWENGRQYIDYNVIEKIKKEI